jgi:uncharacterized protein (DUF488 family)
MPESSENPLRVYTIGHSNHTWETLLQLLQDNHIDIVVDVRSRPYSRFCPHSNKKRLEQSLSDEEISYMYLGNLVGGMPDGDEYYDDDGYVLYDRLVDSPRFQEGISCIEELIAHSRIALMCAEEDPHKCHRRFLIGAVLIRKGVALWHIRKDGTIEVEHTADFSEELSDKLRNNQLNLFQNSLDNQWKSPRPVLPKD